MPALSSKSSSMEDLVLPYGYPLETYPVEAGDGFVLRLYRIPGGKTNSTTKADADSPKPVVLLHHGVTLASSCFVVLDPDSSMGFYLADAGFDVWMVNTRGDTYSRGHRCYRVTDQAYWESSMDEMALIDLPAQVDYILHKTGQASLSLIGHSQGATLSLMLLSARPEYNKKIWLLGLLGAVTHAQFIKAEFMMTQARSRSALLLAGAGAGQFVPNSITSMLTKGCGKTATQTAWCSDLVHFLSYGPTHYISPEDLMRISATWPSGVSTRNLEHWTQIRNAGGGLQMFDYGTQCSAAHRPRFLETCNQARYGQDRPPQYRLENVKVKAALLVGEVDMMAPAAAADQLMADWGADVVFKKVHPKIAHMDFVWAREPLMKQDILNVMWRHMPPTNKPRR